VNLRSGYLGIISANSAADHSIQALLPKFMGIGSISSLGHLGTIVTGMFAMSGFVMLLALDRTIIIFGTKKCKELRKNNVAMGLSITVWVSFWTNNS